MIALLGATGYTGKLVAAELARRQLPHRLGARNPEKLATVPYAPHLRDLLAALLAAPRATALRDAATAFCRHLEVAGVEHEWASERLARA